jgi:putative transposase
MVFEATMKTKVTTDIQQGAADAAQATCTEHVAPHSAAASRPVRRRRHTTHKDTAMKSAPATLAPISDAVVDELMKDYHSPEDLRGEHGILKRLTKALVERAMKAELTHHLGYEKHDPAGDLSGNSRNGSSPKTIVGDFGIMPIEIPRDRKGTFEPVIVGKHQRRWTGFDDKIIAMYALGMSTRQVQEQLKDLYGVDVSPALISQVTDAVMDEVRTWQQRTLDRVYPIVYLDALFLKVHHEGRVVNKAVYLAIAVNMDGKKDLLGVWIEQTEGAKFWLAVVNELKTRGVEDIFLCCIDGLKGFPDAIRTVFPKTEVQLCIIHMVRNSLKYVSFKDRKKVVEDLKNIYRAATSDDAAAALSTLEQNWQHKYPVIAKSWRDHWSDITPFFNYPPDIRRAIYTTNAIESLNSSLRRVIGNRSPFPSDDAVIKILFLSIRRISKRWTMPIHDWGAAVNQFAILYGDRVPLR